MQSIFTLETLLNVLAVVILALVAGFLLYGMVKGYITEKEMRLRNRRRYS